MKLAAVASAAIMMAPVALNSVSTFAATDAKSTADRASERANGRTGVTSTTEKQAAAKSTADRASERAHGRTGVESTTAQQKVQTTTTSTANRASERAHGRTGAVSTTVKQAAQTAVDKAEALYNALPATTKNSTKGNIFLGAINSVKAAIANNDATVLANASKTLTDAFQNLFTTSTGNAATGTGTIADTPNKSTQASDAAKAAANAANAAKQALIDALNQQIKGLEAEKATTTNKATIASLNAAIVALNTRINALKGNTIASTPNKSTEASDAAKAKAKANSRQTGVLKVTYVKGYGIQVWTKDGKMVASDAKGAKAGDKKKLQDGTSWKVFGPSVNINGHNMYNVGGNQYVDAKYVSFTHSVDLAK